MDDGAFPRLQSAEDVLLELHGVELRVVGIRVDTMEEDGKGMPAAEVTSAFTPGGSRPGSRGAPLDAFDAAADHRPYRLVADPEVGG